MRLLHVSNVHPSFSGTIVHSRMGKEHETRRKQTCRNDKHRIHKRKPGQRGRDTKGTPSQRRKGMSTITPYEKYTMRRKSKDKERRRDTDMVGNGNQMSMNKRTEE
uniref:Uncharacterized protein n=1 Tax=Palpitomonas bilix TaxID=652834 RepID=A0A7S3GB10_9EUKA|mmetsp:Transcript_37135/g.96288  ORF Transcript_37135/g.96288 Transcript_37135/m.96288 type:complete len:106 (+) Transcript_37135:3-320(+)